MKKIKVLSIILAISLAVGGCTNLKSDEKESNAIKNNSEKTYSDKIQLAIQKPNTINPITNTDESVLNVLNLVYDGLFELNKNYNAVPKLVKNSKISPDSKQIDIVLKNAKWHDGTPITSEDVAFTVSSIKANKNSPYNYMVQNIANVVVTGDKELTINFNTNNPFIKENLTFPIISKKQLEGKDINNIDANKIGNGIYKIGNYSEREGISLKINKEYYGEIPKSAMDINVNIVPNEEAVVSTVEALESDMVKADSNNLSRFQNKRFKIMKYEGRDYDAVLINQSNPLLSNVNFRRAILSAIDRNAIIENGYMGNIKPVYIPINSNSKYYEKSLKVEKYNPENVNKYIKKIKINKKDKVKETQVNATNKPNNKVNSGKNTSKDTSTQNKKPESNGSENKPSNGETQAPNQDVKPENKPSSGGNDTSSSSGSSDQTRNIQRNSVYYLDEDRQEVYENTEDKKEELTPETNNNIIRRTKKQEEKEQNIEENIQKDNINNVNNGKDANNNIEDKKNNKVVKEKNPYYTEKEIKSMISSITLKIIVNRENSERVKTANMIMENLKAANIKSEVVLLDSLGMQKSLQNKSYDLAVTGWQISSVPNITEIMKNIVPNNAELNKKLDELKNATNEEEVKKIYADIEKYCIDEALFISIGIKDNYMIINKRLETNNYLNDYDQYRGIEMFRQAK
ncbi:ABC transporter substrate-binding protein [Peptacetobacter sp.]|uniref:ABC transporter substrate-binding protein n=1 Tax=Peptacetobacter sp. TaxID=2991975 RepID=UPI0026342BB2|nr:ABC transporter substrate-binding protein [Peptacetobacter sp.]